MVRRFCPHEPMAQTLAPRGAPASSRRVWRDRRPSASKFSRYTYPVAVVALTNFDPAETDVDVMIGTPGYVGITTARRVLAQHGHRGRAPALAVPDGAFAGAAPGEDDALLAPSLRDGVQQDRRPHRHGRRHAADGGQAVARIRPARAARSSCFREYALGNFRELLVEIAKDPAMLYWLDGRLNIADGAAGELRPRADGAVHVRRRALRRDRTSTRRRGCSPAGTCRRPAHAARRRRTVRVQLQRGAARHRTPRTSASPIYRGRQPPDSGAARGDRHAGRSRSDQRAGDPSGDGEPPGAAAVDLVRERDRAARPGVRRRRSHGVSARTTRT